LPTIFPIIRFADSEAGLAWLKDALGFEEHGVFRADDGSIQHGELRLGDAWVMIGTESADGVARTAERTSSFGTGGEHRGSAFTYLAVEDAAAAFDRARAAGADLTSELESRDYGGRDFSLRDSEGNIWSVGEYDPSRAR